MIIDLTLKNTDGTERVIRTENVKKVVYDAGLKSILYGDDTYGHGFSIEDKEFLRLEIVEGNERTQKL